MRARFLTFLALVACSNTNTMTTSDASAAPSMAANEDYALCRGAPAPAMCASGSRVASCGVCIQRPNTRYPLARTRCDDTIRREYCVEAMGTAPNLGCFAPGAVTPGESRRVTMYGTFKVFGNGGDSHHVRITVYRPMADGSPGEMLGSTVSDIEAPGNATEDVYSPSRDRVIQTRRLGAYQLPNIPTETELLVVTEGDPADMTASALFSHRIYDYNIMLRNAEVDMPAAPMGVPGPAVRFDPRVLSNSDWQAIPSAATLVTGIPQGHGVLAGEVHDCDNVRLANAMVSSEPRQLWSGGTVYFSENDTNPLPDMSRNGRGTSLLGTYALLDMGPGPTTVAAVGVDTTGRLQHLGSYRARIYPDSVTVVTFRGLRPWQAGPRP
ncbi:MAG: hypothetical protein HY909_11535 [Deltaproteobacteria bacterium]|nr:hypothetical protein [Deltaproteobacteria bacterium]